MRGTNTEHVIQYEVANPPTIGESMEIAGGIRWLRMPLPFLLGHINLWLLPDGDEWVIIDTGLGSQATRDIWVDVLTRQLQARPVNRILVTHLHPDHVGCAGWLAERCHAPLWMSREEYLLCRILVEDTDKPVPSEAMTFYAQAGFPETALERYQKAFGSFGRMVSPLPQSYVRLFDGMRIKIDGREWKVIIGRGHSVEHACLYCEEMNILISGDQILPTISSNVSVYPTEPQANPLADWLDSLQMLKKVLPEDVLVLPAHGKPFRGAHVRLDELDTEHQTGLQKLRELCNSPIRAIDAFPALFRSEITSGNMIMATGEAIAHLRFLENRGEVRSWIGDDQVKRYQSNQGFSR